MLSDRDLIWHFVLWETWFSKQNIEYGIFSPFVSNVFLILFQTSVSALTNLLVHSFEPVKWIFRVLSKSIFCCCYVISSPLFIKQIITKYMYMWVTLVYPLPNKIIFPSSSFSPPSSPPSFPFNIQVNPVLALCYSVLAQPGDCLTKA